MEETTKDMLHEAATAALSVCLLSAAMLLAAGCRPVGRTAGPVAEPVPAIDTIAYGYETAEGAVVKYDDVETGKASKGNSDPEDDYSGRATAK